VCRPSPDPVAQFVLFRESRDVAAAAGQVNLAMKAADALAEVFDVKQMDARLPALEVLARVVTTPAAHLDLARALEAAADEVIAMDELSSAQKLLQLAGVSADKSKDSALIAAISSRTKELEAWQKEAEKALPALELLKTRPDDPDANLLAGRYLCFLKGDWDAGLPLLKKGPDGDLQILAEAELMGPTTAEDQVVIADAWFDVATGNDPAGQTAMQRRARHWYAHAAPNLSGETKTRVDTRLAELEKTLPAEFSLDKAFWTRLRAVIKDRKYIESRLCGGGFAKVPFFDLPPDGGVLIGFHYILHQQGLITFSYFQPIYLTVSGEKLGQAFGTARPELAKTVKAKKGQVISGLTVRGGGAMDGFSVTFSPFNRTGWGRGGSTTTPWVGGNGGGEARFGFNGSVIIGVHGKFLDNGQVGGLGVFTASVDPRPAGKK
jgi:hypothetical protein